MERPAVQLTRGHENKIVIQKYMFHVQIGAGKVVQIFYFFISKYFRKDPSIQRRSGTALLIKELLRNIATSITLAFFRPEWQRQGELQTKEDLITAT